jgi:branched-chain amino acid transport system permease protein
VAVAALLPLLFSATTVNDGIYVLIYSTVAVSMVVLSGWAGQISLGQFALVGVGACVTGALVVDSNIPFLWSLLLAGVCGGLVAVVLGVPALRLEGLSLAVITLAFAVAASDYFLSSEFFHWTPNVPNSIVLQRFNLGSINTLYEFCLILALVAAVVAHNLRRSRTGRSILSVRDNSRAASAYGISPLRSKLLAFGIAGFIAAAAGAFYVEQQHGVPANSFTPDLSINVFIMVVIGGLGSITGGVIGAVYLEVVSTVLTTTASQLLATGAGVLLVLIIIPEGFGGVVFNIRDRIAAVVARRNGLTPTGEPIEAHAAAASAPVGASNRLAHTAALRLEALESLEVQGEGVTTRAEARPPRAW